MLIISITTLHSGYTGGGKKIPVGTVAKEIVGELEDEVREVFPGDRERS